MTDIYDICQYSTLILTFLIGMSTFLVYKLQNKLIYASNSPLDSRKFVYTPADFEMEDYEDINITTKDGLKINSFLIKKYIDKEKNQLAPSTLLYFHANAGNMGHRLPIVKSFIEECNCNVLIISYRGYGYSEGNANEEGIKIDAQSALDYILQRPDLKDTKIVLFGQSIGGAVAIYLGSHNQDKIHGIILENTFLTMRKLIKHLIPILTYFTFLCHEKWESENELKNFVYKDKKSNDKFIPILLLNSDLDEIVPKEQFEEIGNQIRSARRNASSEKERHFEEDGNSKPDSPEQKLPREQYNVSWYRFDNVHHNDTCMHPEYYDCISSWWKKNISK